MDTVQSSPPAVQTFGKIEDFIKECINSVLSGKWIKHNLLDIEESIDFFSKYDLQWAIKVIKQVESEIIRPEVEAFYGEMAVFYRFMKNVTDSAFIKAITLCSRFKLNRGDIVEIVKRCIDKQLNFCTKFGKLCQNSILQRRIDSPDAENINPPLSDQEILYAASEAVGSVLTDSNAIIGRVNTDIFVTIMDPNIGVQMLKVDGERGNVNTVVMR